MKDGNEDENENKNEDEDKDEIIKILMSSYEDYDDDDDDEINNRKKTLNDHLDKIIDKSKSFEDQIESLEKVENLEEYYFINDFDDKELKFKIFKLKLAHLSNEIDEDLFEQIFDHKFETLANKLIDTTNKEKNQIIVKILKKNKDKLF